MKHLLIFISLFVKDVFVIIINGENSENQDRLSIKLGCIIKTSGGFSVILNSPGI